jgi:hypothetical protein
MEKYSLAHEDKMLSEMKAILRDFETAVIGRDPINNDVSKIETALARLVHKIKDYSEMKGLQIHKAINLPADMPTKPIPKCFRFYAFDGHWAGRTDVKVSLLKHGVQPNPRHSSLEPYTPYIIGTNTLENLRTLNDWVIDADDITIKTTKGNESTPIIAALIHDNDVPIAYISGVPYLPLTAKKAIVTWDNSDLRIAQLVDTKVAAAPSYTFVGFDWLWEGRTDLLVSLINSKAIVDAKARSMERLNPYIIATAPLKNPRIDKEILALTADSVNLNCAHLTEEQTAVAIVIHTESTPYLHMSLRLDGFMKLNKNDTAQISWGDVKNGILKL